MAITLAIAKYGKENFTVTLLEECQSMEQLNRRESFWIDELNTMSPNGYNLTTGGDSKRMSDETKEKIRLANTGRVASDMTKQKLSESHKGFVVFEETRRKLSIANKGKRPPEHVRLAAVAFNQKMYEVTDPTGNVFVVVNMKEFCSDRKFSTSARSAFSEIVNGKRDNYKGWKARLCDD